MTRRHPSLSLMLAAVLLATATPLPAWAQVAKDPNAPRTDALSSDGLTREQMAAALAIALAAAEFTPPDCVAGQEMFADVPASGPFCPWIEELVRRGLTAGCGGGNYCPSAPVNRAQMAAFLVKAQFPTQMPPGVTVTGRWGFDVHADGTGDDWGTSISYPAPMPALLEVQYIEGGEGSTNECPGTWDLPAATPGFLCIYEMQSPNGSFSGTYGNTPFGTTIYFNPDGSGDMFANGTWAATAPSD